MTSILDIYDTLPEDEKEIIDENIIFRIKERKKAKYASEVLLPPALRKYYALYFRTDEDEIPGLFVGLSCRSCRRWIDLGHDDNCPMNELMNDFDYKKAGQVIEKVKAMDRRPPEEKPSQCTHHAPRTT